VVPSYLVRRLGVPVVEFVLWRIDLDTQHSLDLRDPLIDCTTDLLVRILLSMMSNSAALLFGFFLCSRAPAQSITGSNTLVLSFSVVVVRYHRL